MAATDVEKALAICTGNTVTVPGQPDWQNPVIWNEHWGDDFCFDTFNQIMFTVPGEPGRVYNPTTLQNTVQPYMQLILNRFNGEYNILPGNVRTGNPNLVMAVNSLQNRILSACSRLPGACDPFLDGPLVSNPDFMTFFMSAPFCQNKTREQIADSSAFTQFCGCFSPPIVSQKVKQELGNNKSCDPLCDRVDTIQLPDGKGNFLECPDDTVCVINAVSITAAESEVGGGINFEQICTCKENCRCIIESETSINQTLAKIGLTGNFNQLCTQSSACVLFNEQTDTDTYVTCPGTSGGTTPEQEQKITILFWTIGIIVAVVIVIIALFIGLNIRARR